jgi:streptomycin 6-kinase
MLLERLHGERSLESVADDDEAIGVVGLLLTRLHRPLALDGFPTVSADPPPAVSF